MKNIISIDADPIYSEEFTTIIFRLLELRDWQAINEILKIVLENRDTTAKKDIKNIREFWDKTHNED